MLQRLSSKMETTPSASVLERSRVMKSDWSNVSADA